MKVLFVVTGVGLGDATREHAHIEALKRKVKGVKVLVAGYDNSYEYFKNKYKTIKIKGYKFTAKEPEFKVLPFIFRNYFLPILWFFSTWRVKAEAKKFNPDVIVSDFEPGGLILAKMLKKKCILVFGFDPYLFEEYKEKNPATIKVMLEAKYFTNLYNRADLTVIPTLLGAKKERLLYTYINPVMREMPRDLQKEEQIMRELGLERKPILVMLGGSTFGGELAKNLNSIAKNFDEDFIIFGHTPKLSLKQNVKCYLFKENFLEYLKVCKGVITLGGQKTLTECLAFKKPMLIFPIKNHVEQLLNAYTLRDYAAVGDKVTPKELKIKIGYFLSNLDVIKKKIKKAKIDFNGAEQFVKLLKLVSKE